MNLAYKTSTPDEAYAKIKEGFTTDKLKKYGVSGEFSYNDSNHSMSVTGKGFNVDISCLEGGLDVNLKLGLLLKPLKGKINQILKSELEVSL